MNRVIVDFLAVELGKSHPSLIDVVRRQAFAGILVPARSKDGRLANVEDIVFERGIDLSHETIRCCWPRFGPIFAAEIRKRSINGRNCSNWRWHLDQVFVRINGGQHDLCYAVDREGELLEAFVTHRRDPRAALNVLKRTMKRHGRP